MPGVLTPLQTAVAREPGLPCRNYNCKRVNILHQDDHRMQNVAGAQFADRDEAAGGAHQTSTGRRCPDFKPPAVAGRTVGAVSGPLAIAIATTTGRTVAAP